VRRLASRLPRPASLALRRLLVEVRYRGHGWAPVWEMTGAMFVPSFAAIGLLWAGVVVDTDPLLYIQHIGMFPIMLAVMLFRLDEYTGHGGHAHAAA
jgi:hypothetical protein